MYEEYHYGTTERHAFLERMPFLYVYGRWSRCSFQNDHGYIQLTLQL